MAPYGSKAKIIIITNNERLLIIVLRSILAKQCRRLLISSWPWPPSSFEPYTPPLCLYHNSHWLHSTMYSAHFSHNFHRFFPNVLNTIRHILILIRGKNLDQTPDWKVWCATAMIHSSLLCAWDGFHQNPLWFSDLVICQTAIELRREEYDTWNLSRWQQANRKSTCRLGTAGQEERIL